MNLNTIIILLSTIIVPVTVGTILFSRLPSYARYVVIFFYANLVSDAASLAFTKFYGNNMIVFYVFVSAASVLLGVAYSKLHEMKLIPFFLIIPAIAIIEGLLGGVNHFNSISFTIFNALLVFTSLYSYYRMTLLEIGRDSFYFNGVILFYSLSSSLFFFSGKYLQQTDVQLMMQLFNIHAIINSVTNLFFAYSIWRLFRSYSLAL